jgi:predicted nucleic acid-binding protein
MKVAFADTFYFLALLNERDPAQRRAVAASREPDRAFLTTEFVLLELADALSKPPLRAEFKALYDLIQRTKSFRVVPATTELIQGGSLSTASDRTRNGN